MENRFYALLVLICGVISCAMTTPSTQPTYAPDFRLRYIDFMSKMLRVPQPIPRLEPLPAPALDTSCTQVRGPRSEIRNPTPEWADMPTVLAECLLKDNPMGETCCGSVVGEAVVQCIELDASIALQGEHSTTKVSPILMTTCRNPTIVGLKLEYMGRTQYLPGELQQH